MTGPDFSIGWTNRVSNLQSFLENPRFHQLKMSAKVKKSRVFMENLPSK